MRLPFVIIVLLALLSFTFGGIAILADGLGIGMRIFFLLLQAFFGIAVGYVLFAIYDDIDSGR